MKLASSSAALALLLVACGGAADPQPMAATDFTVRVENVSLEDTLSAAQAVPLSPGAWIVSDAPNALFTPGEAAGEGLEAIAEDGNPALIAPELAGQNAAVFNTPVDAAEPGPILPGERYSFEFQAEPGERLGFVTMFIQSNDWFYAPGAQGVALFNEDGEPISGDISDQVKLWDAGTEMDEPAGLGSNQAPRQSEADTGEADEDTAVRPVSEAALSALNGPVLQTSLSSTTQGGVTTFTLILENVSTPTSLTPTLAVPLSPGVWTLGTKQDVFFTLGAADRGQGLEPLAEDGIPGEQAQTLEGQVKEVGTFARGVGEDENGPIGPGGAYEFTFSARAGDALNLATMFIESNDWIYATRGVGIPLFADGEPITGDVTEQIGLYDVGTEADQTPGAGSAQPRIGGNDVGDVDENNLVRTVEDLDLNGDVVKVTLTPN